MSATSDGSAESSADARRLEFQLSLNTSRDDALEAAIKAAERSMQALKLSTDANEKTKLSQKVKSLLDEAETIKQNDDWKTALEKMSKDRASTTKARELKQPESKRKLSTREQILLLNASFLHGFKFPPWTSPPEASEFELQDGEQLFLYVSLKSSSVQLATNRLFNQRHAGFTTLRFSRRRVRWLETAHRCPTSTYVEQRSCRFWAWNEVSKENRLGARRGYRLFSRGITLRRSVSIRAWPLAFTSFSVLPL